MQFLNMILLFCNIVVLVLVSFSEDIDITFNVACDKQENQEQSPNSGEDKRRN